MVTTISNPQRRALRHREVKDAILKATPQASRGRSLNPSTFHREPQISARTHAGPAPHRGSGLTSPLHSDSLIADIGSQTSPKQAEGPVGEETPTQKRKENWKGKACREGGPKEPGRLWEGEGPSTWISGHIQCFQKERTRSHHPNPEAPGEATSSREKTGSHKFQAPCHSSRCFGSRGRGREGLPLCWGGAGGLPHPHLHKRGQHGSGSEPRG